jgi:hypothetical protein
MSSMFCRLVMENESIENTRMLIGGRNLGISFSVLFEVRRLRSS